MNEKNREIRIVVKASLETYWVESFPLEGCSFDMLDSVRKKAVEDLKKGLDKKLIVLNIKTDVIFE
ncbi:hypothetical protein LCGC14_1470830 [marine sediment metagenome]|uniref:Uncharacterized protein n=1 Tax=marine sediment metagenome TaxID=412755 RepID=A0A0F9LSW7_9ZZZZ